MILAMVFASLASKSIILRKIAKVFNLVYRATRITQTYEAEGPLK
jgi:hypothetical protein